MCDRLDHITATEAETEIKGKTYYGLRVMCLCGIREYFVSISMPFHKFIIPLDKDLLKRFKREINKLKIYQKKT